MKPVTWALFALVIATGIAGADGVEAGLPEIPSGDAAPLALDAALAQAASDADPEVIRLAVSAMSCAVSSGQQQAQRLAVIDYSRPSTAPRLWVFALDTRELLFRELVAHGRNSGDNYAVAFSDEPGSHRSSLGLFRTLQPYEGKHGYSLRLDGLEPGINQNALGRAVVIHGADYVSDQFASEVGRIGRSFGCPAVREAVARPMVDTLKNGSYIFAYYPDAAWLKSSRYLNCDVKTQVAQK